MKWNTGHVARASRPCEALSTGETPVPQGKIASPMLRVAFLAAWVCAFVAPAAHAQVSVARELVEQATEQIFKSAGREGIEQLTAMGGRTAVREVLEQSSREGGEQLVKRVTQYGVEEGPAALRAIRFAPAKMVDALDGLSPGLRQAGLRAVERDPQALTNLVKEYGSGAVEVAARHPGVGEELVGKLGPDGISLGRKLTTDESIVAARCADDIAALGPAERQGIVSKILQSPKPVLDFLETHPRILRTAAGVAVVMAVKDDILGDRGRTVVGPDGKLLTTPAHPGLIERILPQSLHAASGPVSIIGTAVAFGVLGWFTVHLVGKWRVHSLRVKAGRAMAIAEVKATVARGVAQAERGKLVDPKELLEKIAELKRERAGEA